MLARGGSPADSVTGVREFDLAAETLAVPALKSARAFHRLRVVAAVSLLGLAVLRANGASQRPQSIEVDLQPHGTIRWDRGREPVLIVLPGRGDGWITIARRYCSTDVSGRDVDDANPRLSQPLRDRPVAVPVAVLRADLRVEAVRRLFPADRRVQAGWEHWVLDPFGGGEESWTLLARLFTDRPEGAESLRAANPEDSGAAPRRGRKLLFPTGTLRAEFRSLTPADPPPQVATPEPRADRDVPLNYGADDQGAYALYRLERGEALYSAVVVRFTGQVYASQVNATAAEIARRSGIEDVTDIPIGYPIKIPVELLLPKYLPADDPGRIAWEQERRELGKFLEIVSATDLSGVHVVIDAGHGGADTGAIVDQLWEATYVYDVACRIKSALERHTQATVWVTRQDAARGFVVPDLDRLPQHRDQFLLTRPPYTLQDSVLGVHLRWYLTNDIILNRLGNRVPRSKTVFLSVHADSLHPSVRGAMVYVPSRYLRPTTYTVDRRDIREYAEYRNHPTVRLGSEFKARVEASSRRLAEHIIDSLDRNQVEVHPDDPVRDRVLRGRRSWVPAVLRYTAAQNAVLVECCNMANDADRSLLVDRRWREEFARGVVEGMAAAFSGSG
jgi:N-acetylmuramoyl-L-alanine amidase